MKAPTGSPLTEVLLRGPILASMMGVGLPANRMMYAVQMPPFAAAMNDADLAETLNLVRRAFGRSASAITAAEVAARRQQP